MNTKDTAFSGRPPDSSGSRSLAQELFVAGLYKRNQGRLVRQLTCLALWLFVGASAWRLHQLYLRDFQAIGYASALAIGALGAWVAYRLVNWAKFADFLISVEAELNKVSWPTRKELIRASLVVIFTIIFLSALLFAYDAIWRLLFVSLGIAS